MTSGRAATTLPQHSTATSSAGLDISVHGTEALHVALKHSTTRAEEPVGKRQLGRARRRWRTIL